MTEPIKTNIKLEKSKSSKTTKGSDSGSSLTISEEIPEEESPTTTTVSISIPVELTNLNRFKKSAKSIIQSKRDEVTSPKNDFSIQILPAKQKTKRKVKPILTTTTPNDDTNFDLYKTSNASLIYIKKKYKMYLDWLAENSSVDPNGLLSNPQKISPMSNRHQSEPQLNWYNYEKTLISSNNKSYFKYIESLNRDPSKLSSFGQKTPRTTIKSLDFKNVKFDGQPNLYPPSINKFLSQLSHTTSNNSTPPLAMFPKKPILKLSSYSDEQTRRGSVQSIGSDQFSLSSSGKWSSVHSMRNLNSLSKKQNNNNNQRLNLENLNKLEERVGQVKLPPIARCSEDFYAVLHGMEKDRLA